jgi:hypothetical protein
MNTLTKKLALSTLVILLSACAHYPGQYGNYPGEAPYYSGSSYGNYQQRQQYYPRQPIPGYGGNGRSYGGYPSDNYYYQNNNYYNRYQSRPYHGNHHDQNNYPEHRDDHYGNRGNDRQWNSNNPSPNRGGWQGRNNQPQLGGQQPVIINQDNRNYSIGRREHQPNDRWQGNGRNNDNHPRNEGGWQGRNNQVQTNQQSVANPPGGRYRPPGNDASQGNGAWAGHQQGDNQNHRKHKHDD